MNILLVTIPALATTVNRKTIRRQHVLHYCWVWCSKHLIESFLCILRRSMCKLKVLKQNKKRVFLSFVRFRESVQYTMKRSVDSLFSPCVLVCTHPIATSWLWLRDIRTYSRNYMKPVSGWSTIVVAHSRYASLCAHRWRKPTRSALLIGVFCLVLKATTQLSLRRW